LTLLYANSASCSSLRNRGHISEARRVLRSGGVFIFNLWDRIEENEFADTVTAALEAPFPEDPPRFLARTPHGYYDHETIKRDLASSGFTESPEIITLAARSRAESFRIPAIAYCQGTPLRNEIEARDRSRLGAATTSLLKRLPSGSGAGL
jgi:SAM-dependent methyltransferase